MRRVADEVKATQRRALAAHDAARVLRRRRQQGRRASRCLQESIG